MKNLFKEGCFLVSDDGRKVFRSAWSGDQYADSKFVESRFNISSLISAYDFEKIDDTQYYCIYKKGLKSDISFDDINASIKKILCGNREDIVNKETTTLGLPNEDFYEHTVFWDVINDFIVVKGEENLKPMCIELLMIGYERLGIKRSQEVDDYFVSSAVNNPLLEKALKLDKNNASLTK